MRLPAVIAGTILAALVATSAMAEGIGQTMAVIDAADASGRVGNRTLAVGSQIFIGDVVSTDTNGEAQLLFKDGTRMVVGPGSSLVIDDLVFRGKSAENRFLVEAATGRYRFISGDAGDESYSIRTPSATIGVRGTAFDYTVLKSGRTRLLLFDGAATMCGEGDNCETVDTQCEMLTAGAGQKVQRIPRGSGLARDLLEDFPYVASQDTLLGDFQVDDHGCDQAAGGLSEFALDQPGFRTPLRIAGAAVAGGIILCLLSGCDGGGGGGGGSAIDTNNGTN